MAQVGRLLGILSIASIVGGAVLHLNSGPQVLAHGDAVDAFAQLRERDDLNVLFLVVDTLRSDRLSSYGYERNTSPMVDALARRGIRFARHGAQSSWTKASMASLWTSTDPVSTGILRFDDALPDAALMPAEILQARGMVTAGIWRNGWVARNFGFGQGFDVYHRPSQGAVHAAVRRETPTSRIAGSDEDITRSALEFIRVEGHRPWLLYLHYMDVHQYLSDERSARFGTSYSDIYDNSIHWVDRQIGILLDAIAEAGLRERTIVVLVADHGEAFGEHDNEGHAKDVYGEVVRTPFILSLPFEIEPGIVVETTSRNIDVWPTLLDLLGERVDGAADGRSLIPDVVAAVEHSSSPDGGLAFAHLDRSWGRVGVPPRWIVAVTNASHRLIYYPDGERRSELFDIREDPAEQRDRYEEDVEAAEALERAARAYVARGRASWALEEKTVEIDELMMGQLRAIGYAIE